MIRLKSNNIEFDPYRIKPLQSLYALFDFFTEYDNVSAFPKIYGQAQTGHAGRMHF